MRKGLPAKVRGYEHLSADLLGTVRHNLLTGKTEIKYQRKNSATGIFVVFLIDSSGSMVRDKQIAWIKGLIAQTVKQYAHRRVAYAAVA